MLISELALVVKGFNRYIVECKYRTSSRNSIHRLRFNRYIVECKFIPKEKIDKNLP